MNKSTAHITGLIDQVVADVALLKDMVDDENVAAMLTDQETAMIAAMDKAWVTAQGEWFTEGTDQ